MTASTVDAISGRIQQAHSGEPPTAAVSLGGASSFTDALLAHGRALGSGTLDLNGLLAGSSFTLPLNQNGSGGSGGSGPMRDLTLWGSGDYRSISDANPQSMAYDGEVVSASLGVDTRLGENLLGGLSVALARGAVDYTDPETVTGELTTSLSSVNPYVGWQSAGGGTSVWAAAGYGWGEVEVEESTGAQASDLTQRMVAAGGEPLAGIQRPVDWRRHHEPAREGRNGVHAGRHRRGRDAARHYAGCEPAPVDARSDARAAAGFGGHADPVGGDRFAV